MRDFPFILRMKDDKGVLHAPIGRIGHMGDPGVAIKTDIVLAGMLRQAMKHLAPEVPGMLKARFKGTHGFVGTIKQFLDFETSCFIFARQGVSALLHLLETMTQGV